MNKNIMVDPRVCRGSVSAMIREQQRLNHEKIMVRRAEERFKTDLLRSKLTIAMNRGGVSLSSECLEVGNSSTIVNRRELTQKQRGIARLAGPVGRKSAGILAPPDKRPVIKLPLINEPAKKPLSNRKIASNLSREESGLQNVRFEPILKPDMSLVAKVIPTLPPAAPVRPFLPPISPTLPSDKPAAEITPRRRGRSFRPIRETTGIHSPWAPPPTASGPPIFADASIQTEEEFERSYGLLISEMVESAIIDARRKLLEEEEIEQLEERNRKLLADVDKRNEENFKLCKTIEEQLKTQEKIEQQKEAVIQQLNAMESRRMAGEVLDSMMDRSVEELVNKSLIHDPKAVHSVAADTRHMEREQQKHSRLVTEVAENFFPYAYQRAERLFVHRLADSYLRDALFAHDDRFKADSLNRLNQQIQQYSNTK